MLEIFNFFSNNISQILKGKLKDMPTDKIKTLEEIRIRSNGTIILRFSEDEQLLEKRIKYEEIIETMQRMCNNSIYSYQNEIRNGYITVKGGHRVRYKWKLCDRRWKTIKHKLYLKHKF